MQRSPHLAGLLLCCAAAAISSQPAVGQVDTWPNRISFTIEHTTGTISAGPVQSNGFVVMFFFPASVAQNANMFTAMDQGATYLGHSRADSTGAWQLSFPMKTFPRDIRLGLYALEAGSFNFIGALVPRPRVFEAPPRPDLSDLDFEVYPDHVVKLNGPGAADDEVVLDANPYQSGNQWGNPLVAALWAATPGSAPKIGIYGNCRVQGQGEGMWLGGAQDSQKAHHVHWGDVPMQFAVIGMTPDAEITGFAVARNVNGPNGFETAGIGDVIFQNLTIRPAYWGAMAIGGNHCTFGRMRFYDCHFAPHPQRMNQFYGYGYKWAIRVPAYGSWTIEDCTFAPPQEHNIYIDSPQGDSFFVGVDHIESMRTAIQIVQRAWELPNVPSNWQGTSQEWFDLQLEPYENGTKEPNPPGRGRILIEGLRGRAIVGEGGGLVTLVGFLGDIWLRDLNLSDLVTQNHKGSGVVCWTDAGIKHGVHAYTDLEGNIFTTRRLFLDNVNINLPNCDRDHIAIAGVEKVHIISFDVQGNRTALALDRRQDSPNMRNKLMVLDGEVVRMPDEDRVILNGRVFMYVPRPVASYPGFNSAQKVKTWTSFLTDAEINARWP